jgi:thiol-disulfide isomerase/thioredoxin
MRKYYFILYCIANFLICTLSFIFGPDWQFFIIGTSNMIVGTLLMQRNPYNPTLGKILIFGPFLLLYFILSSILIFENNYNGIPFLAIALFSSVVSIGVYKRQLKKVATISLLVVALYGIGSLYLRNYYDWILYITDDVKLEGKSLVALNLDLRRENGSPLDVDEFRGKISVIDIWSSACGICIREFPTFEQIHNQYKSAGDISFYTLNIELNSDKPEKVRRFTKPFTFNTLYTNENGFDKLGISGVPYYLIVDQDLKIRYCGSLLVGNTCLYKNFHSVLNDVRRNY